jgi:two-component system, NarL family, response regulator NreC
MTKKKTTVLVCDDHAVFREGVKQVLSSQPDIDVVGEASNGLEAVQLARKLRPDIVLMDIAMPLLRGFDATQRIKKYCPEAKVLIFSIYEEDDMVARCLAAGAAGYVLKDTPPMQLIYAIQSVNQGEKYMSPKIVKSFVTQHVQRTAAVSTPYDLLSDREREVLISLAEGESLKEVAERLHLSVKTVDAHKCNIMRKLELHNRSELIRYAIRTQLIRP